MSGSVVEQSLGRSIGPMWAVAVSLLAGAALAEPVQIDSIVATVNDDIVLRSEVDQRYQSFLLQLKNAQVPESERPSQALIEDRILERLILERIQLQMAEARGVFVDDETLNNSIATYAQQNNLTVERLREQLETEGAEYTQFREELRQSLVMQRLQRAMVDRLIFISSEEVATFRATPAFKEYASDQFRLGHILLKPGSDKLPEEGATLEEKANLLVEQLRAGSDFAGLAIRHSEASTALEGGDMGWRKLSEVPSLFVEQVQDLKTGEIAEPIRNALGLHIVQVLERQGATLAEEERWHIRHILVKPSTIKSLEDARAEIEEVRGRILAGEDFGALAEEFSDDPGSALVGGDLGWADIAGFVPEFQEAARNAPLDELTEPFQTDFGWHILEVMGRRMEDMSEEKLNDLALNVLYNRFYNERLEEWLSEIRDDAYVVVVGDTTD